MTTQQPYPPLFRSKRLTDWQQYGTANSIGICLTGLPLLWQSSKICLLKKQSRSGRGWPFLNWDVRFSSETWKSDVVHFFYNPYICLNTAYFSKSNHCCLTTGASLLHSCSNIKLRENNVLKKVCSKMDTQLLSFPSRWERRPLHYSAESIYSQYG